MDKQEVSIGVLACIIKNLANGLALLLHWVLASNCPNKNSSPRFFGKTTQSDFPECITLSYTDTTIGYNSMQIT